MTNVLIRDKFSSPWDVAQAILERVAEDSIVTFRFGSIYLEPATALISQQINLDDEDELKHFDFTKSKFWITTDSGTVPIGIDTAEELVEFCEKYEIVL